MNQQEAFEEASKALSAWLEGTGPAPMLIVGRGWGRRATAEEMELKAEEKGHRLKRVQPKG